jgi:hypothetical protein
MVKLLFSLVFVTAFVATSFGSISCPNNNPEWTQNYVHSNGAQYTILGGGGSLRSALTTNSNCNVQCSYGKSDGSISGRIWNGVDLLQLPGGDWAFDCQEVGKTGASNPDSCTDTCPIFYVFVYNENSLTGQDTQQGQTYDSTTKIAIERTRLVTDSCPTGSIDVPSGLYTVPKLQMQNAYQTVDCSAAEFTVTDENGVIHTAKGNWQLKSVSSSVTDRSPYNLPVYTIGSDGLSMINYGRENINSQGVLHFDGTLTVHASIQCGPACTSFSTCDAKTDAPYIKQFNCPPYEIVGPPQTEI